MKKRMLAMMMAIVMVMTLLPTSALAVGDDGEASETDSGAVFRKTVHQEDNGNVKITLEAWATGQTVQTTKQKPLDIVLVLDQSGSMADDFDEKTSRQEAMKNAVNEFIDKVAEKYTADAAHRISIVTFGSEAKVLQNWTEVVGSGQKTLNDQIKGLNHPSGATNVAEGMTLAQTQLKKAQDKHKKVVVVFTDGVPTTSNVFDTEVATKAIATAKDLKADQTEIYTIGIFNGVKAGQLHGEKWAYSLYKDVPCTGEEGSCWGGSWAAGLFGGNDFADIDVAAGNRFLNYLSSNFAEATEIGVKRGRYDPSNTLAPGDGYKITRNFDRFSSDYYLTATDSEHLNNVFTQISENINSAVNAELGTTAAVKDTMTEYFNLPDNTTDIKVYTQDRKADGSWDVPAKATGTTVNIDDQTVTVTGYDYAKNFVSEAEKADGSYGQKLVIEFTITPNWTKLAQDKKVEVPTNKDAGLYLGENAVATGQPGKASFCGVKYDANGGKGTVPATQIGVNGTKFTVASCNTLKKDKAVLLGFSAEKKDLVTSESEAAGVVTEYAPAKDKLAILYAVWAEDENGNGMPDYKDDTYTITYAKGTTDTVSDMPAEVTDVLAGTEQTVSSKKPTREGYTFSRWTTTDVEVKDDKTFTMPENNVTFTAQWTANDVTITFDANGGKWAADANVANYELNTDKTKASKTYQPSDTVEKITPDPANGTKKFVGWGIRANATEPLSLLALSPQAAKLKELTEGTGTLYAIWEDAAQPTEKLNYTIHQHYIGSNGKQDAQFNDELPKTASAGTKISELIPAELQKDREYYYQTYIYLSSETKIVNGNVATPVADDTVLNKNNTQIHLYYYLDAWNDKNDTLTGGDGIPDKYQAVVTYKVVGGTWKDGKTDDQVQVFTLKTKNKETGVWEDANPAPTLDNTIPTGMISSYSRTASQSWNKGITKDTKVTESVTYTYTFTKGSSGGGSSGGSSGGGGGRKPTVTIPDDVPTGLNGDDHFAYIVGYPDGNVKPGGNITRAEVATIFFRLLTEDVRTANSTQANSLSDVSRGQWFNHAISTLSSMGIVKGNPDGTFDPDAPITRAEFAAIAARFDDKNTNNTSNFSDIASHWAKDEIGVAANKGWINGYPDSTFRPDQYITRAEAMTLVNRVLNRLPEKSEDLLDDMIKWPDNADASVWYYLAVQEATNSHDYSDKSDADKYEKWTKLRENRDWTELEK